MEVRKYRSSRMGRHKQRFHATPCLWGGARKRSIENFSKIVGFNAGSRVSILYENHERACPRLILQNLKHHVLSKVTMTDDFNIENFFHTKLR